MPIEYIYVLCMDLRTKTTFALYNNDLIFTADIQCLLHGTDWSLNKTLRFVLKGLGSSLFPCI
jgi:hypothetical protein